MYFLGLILTAVLQTCKGCLSVAEEGKIVDSTVKLTNNMTLKCVYPKTATITQMSWIKSKRKEAIAVFRLPHDLHITSTYEGRVNIVNHTVNDKSLVFSSTTEADVGLYVCSFQTFPYGIWEKKVQVVQSGNFTPPVSAGSHIITGPGKNVTFRCGTAPVIAMKHVTWERAHEGTVDTIVKCTQLSQSVHGSDYEERVEINCSTQANTIVLWNVTASDSGMFRCCYIGASGESGVHWTKLTVTVNVPSDYKMNIVAIAGGAGAGAAVLLLILILSIAAAVVHHRKKKRKRIMPPKVFLTTQPQHFCGRMNASERETMTASATKREAIYVNYSGGQKMRHFCGRMNASERETMTASATKREAIYVNYSGGQKMRV
ncbi:PREDICTED: CD226 antigen [Gekko japonicus]|uniref:CD226 antigen n=1 Tax=Gekko japonicus TaxID=146911 RepID=A0ABM1JNS7_GEKJA|nr:PREDICTED: CD226 antigen [Gekko japonicus]